MKYLYIFLFTPIFAIYGQTKGTVLKYEVYYNFTTPLSREIDVYATSDNYYSIEKMNSTKKVAKNNINDNKEKLPEIIPNSLENSSTVLAFDVKWNDLLIYNNKLTNKLYTTVQNIDLGRNITVEETPKINWQIVKETKTVKDLNCTKAIANFRGIDWEIWFTNEIPLPYGPWKLQGAPGLIVEANTADKKIHFLLNTIQYNKILPEIKLPNLKEIDLKEYVDLLDEIGNYEYYEDRNTKVSKQSNTRSPFELIYEWEENK